MDNEITGTCGNAMPDEIHRQWEAAHRLSLAPTPTLTVIGAAAGELAELRAKLKTAEAQLAAATERAEKAEFRARHLEMTNVVPMQNAINDAVRAQAAAEEKFRQAQQDGYFGRLAAQTACERDALASQNAALRAALEMWQAHMRLSKKPLETDYGELLSTLARAEMATAEALALTPPAVMKKEDTCEK